MAEETLLPGGKVSVLLGGMLCPVLPTGSCDYNYRVLAMGLERFEHIISLNQNVPPLNSV